MKKQIFKSIGLKILSFYIFLSLINISFILSIIFENQVDLITKNTMLESEKQLSELINAIKKFTTEIKQGSLFNVRNEKEILNQIIKTISLHSKNYIIFTEKNDILYKSAEDIILPETYEEDGRRSMTAMTFSGKEYYLRIEEEKKLLNCYIPLGEFLSGTPILLVKKDISIMNTSLRNLYRQAVYVIIVVIFFHLLFALILFRYIIHPINLLSSTAKNILQGDFSGPELPVIRDDELGMLTETFNKMSVSISDNIKNLSAEMETFREKNEKREKTATRDELTSLFNRAYLHERIGEELNKARITKREIAFLQIDLDNFKNINSIYGYQTGNIILLETARIIAGNSGYNDIAARIRDDEFAVLSVNSSLNYIRDMAEKIRSDIEKNEIITPDGKLSITISIGVSYVKDASMAVFDNFNKFTEPAEKALILAKNNGRNRVEFTT
jgi:diguanylate cyclase (GGDEF)-like protein